ncbi:14874_t:CDS:2, partial [Acaulospora colombiana]
MDYRFNRPSSSIRLDIKGEIYSQRCRAMQKRKNHLICRFLTWQRDKSSELVSRLFDPLTAPPYYWPDECEKAPGPCLIEFLRIFYTSIPINRLKAQHYQQILEHEVDVWNRVLDK